MSKHPTTQSSLTHAVLTRCDFCGAGLFASPHQRQHALKTLESLDLDIYEFRLLAYYIERGTCHNSVRQIAHACRIGHAVVIRTRNRLEKKGYIITWRSHARDVIHTKVNQLLIGG